MNNQVIPAESDEKQSVRIFQSPDSIVTGKSVVLDRILPPSESCHEEASDLWPYSLTDYLKSHVGKVVQIEYVMPNGRYMQKRGIIRVTGTNFIGIQPIQTRDLFLVELSSIKSVNIMNYQAKSPNMR